MQLTAITCLIVRKAWIEGGSAFLISFDPILTGLARKGNVGGVWQMGIGEGEWRWGRRWVTAGGSGGKKYTDETVARAADFCAMVIPKRSQGRTVTDQGVPSIDLSGRIRMKTGWRKLPWSVSCMQVTSMTWPTSRPALASAHRTSRSL